MQTTKRFLHLYLATCANVNQDHVRIPLQGLATKLPRGKLASGVDTQALETLLKKSLYGASREKDKDLVKAAGACFHYAVKASMATNSDQVLPATHWCGEELMSGCQ